MFPLTCTQPVVLIVNVFFGGVFIISNAGNLLSFIFLFSAYFQALKETCCSVAVCSFMWFNTLLLYLPQRPTDTKESRNIQNPGYFHYFHHAERRTHARLSSPPCRPFAWHIACWATTMGWVTTTAGINTVLQSRLSSALYNIHALLFLKIKATVTCLSFKRPAAALLSLYMLHIPLFTTRQHSLQRSLQASGP